MGTKYFVDDNGDVTIGGTGNLTPYLTLDASAGTGNAAALDLKADRPVGLDNTIADIRFVNAAGISAQITGAVGASDSAGILSFSTSGSTRLYLDENGYSGFSSDGASLTGMDQPFHIETAANHANIVLNCGNSVGSNYDHIIMRNQGITKIQLIKDNSDQFVIGTASVSEALKITQAGIATFASHIYPDADNANLLGHSSGRWQATYTNIVDYASTLSLQASGTEHASLTNGQFALNKTGSTNDAARLVSGASSGSLELLGTGINVSIGGGDNGDSYFNSGGTVIIGATTADDDAILEVTSTTQGVLLPRMSTTQRDNITTPPEGLLVWNLTDNQLNNYDGTTWTAVAGSGGGSAIARRQVQTAAGSQTVFNLTGGETFTNDTLHLRVFLNGQLLRPGSGFDYVETDSDTITLDAGSYPTGATAGDVFEFLWLENDPTLITPVGAVENREEFTYTSGPQVFNLSGGKTYTTGGVNLRVYVNGAIQIAGTNYTETDNDTFEFDTLSPGALVNGDKITAVWTTQIGQLTSVVPATEARENFTTVGDATERIPASGNFATTFTPGGDNLKVYLDGVLMTLGDDYTEDVGGNYINFTFTPSAGQKVAVAYITGLAPTTAGSSVDERSDQSGDGSTTQFNMPFTYVKGSGNLQVFEDGVLLRAGSDYTETTSSRVDFTSAPPNGAKVTFLGRGISQIGAATTVGGYTADDLIGIAMLF